MKGLIQRLGGFQKGNFELVVVRRGGELQHWWRDNNDPKLPWYLGNGGKPIVTNVREDPSLIQSNFGTKGNFEVLIGYTAELHHLFRDNDDPKLPWYPGNGGKRIVNYAAAPSLIQSNFGTKGNFEAVVLNPPSIEHWWRDNDDPKQPWHQSNGGKPIVKEYALNPSLIQSRFGKNGNFELLVSIRRGMIGSDPAFGLYHLYRDNDDPNPDTAWIEGNGGKPIINEIEPLVPLLIQSNLGNFEALVGVNRISGSGTWYSEVQHWYRDNSDPKLPWHQGNGGNPITTDATPLGFIQSVGFGTKHNFEAIIIRSGRLEHWYRDNDDPNPDTAWIQGNGGKPILVY